MSGGLGLLFSRRGIMMHSAEGLPKKQTADPLYIENVGTKTTQVKFSNGVEYSLDKIEWVALPSNTYTPLINPGERVYFRAKDLTPINSSGIGTFFVYNKIAFNVGGDVMSMIYGADFEEFEATLQPYALCKLFNGCTNLKSAENLLLPATTLTTGCYMSMFYGCTALTAAPELPATTLATNCYSSMFRNCTSLKVAPELPATTLASYCYNTMFYDCTSLEVAPELPATTLATYCYSSMFRNCTSLKVAPELPATTLTAYCYISMFHDCTSLEVAPELPATTLKTYCYYTMFRNCASLEVAPELPATTLATYCYNTMFYDCKKLRYVKALFTSSPSSDYTGSWLTNVAPIGTFVKNASATWDVVGANGVPEGWTIETAES